MRVLRKVCGVIERKTMLAVCSRGLAGIAVSSDLNTGREHVDISSEGIIQEQ